MKKTIHSILFTVSTLLISALLISSCKKSSDTPAPEDERIALVKKWVSKWSFMDLTKVEPKVEYFTVSRNAKEMIYGDKEFSLERAKSLDTLTLLFDKPPVKPAAGELPNLKGFYYLKRYDDFSADRLNLEMTPATDGKSKGTVVVKQIFAGSGILDGQIDIWRVTFVVPK